MKFNRIYPVFNIKIIFKFKKIRECKFKFRDKLLEN